MVKRLELASGISEEFNHSVKSMIENAYLDMEGEGLEREKVTVTLEVAMNSEVSPEETVVPWSSLLLKEEEVKALKGLYEERSGIKAEGKVFVMELRLRARYPLVHPEFPIYTPVGEGPEKAFKGERQAFWGGEPKDVPVYEQKHLKCGNAIKGPAILESDETTILVPPDAIYRVDQYLNAIMEEA
jgi:N-methylhydantoinase A/acetophenone carboxylase